MALTFRGLEMHGHRIWERARIVEALQFIRDHEMNALVLHESDLLHQITFPRAYFDPYAQWKSAPTRRGENALQNNRVYLDHILNLARCYQTDVWLEVKELAFPDEVLEMRPELVKDGVVCPSEPFWREFISTKIEEVLTDFPLLAGLIVSPGSPEGRASRAQNKCGCQLCAETSLTDWYGGIIEALHEPIARHGKRLAVRDFAYKPSDHRPLIEAVDRAPQDIIFCIKATPHDFYPTFPDNPALGALQREQWIEYDVQGQFYGWGITPCFMFGDLARRLRYAEGAGITGGLFRTEWERVNDWWCLESLNVLNLIAAATLAKDENITPEDVCAKWLRSRNLPMEHAKWLADVLAATWPIMRAALYIDDFVFADCSMFPRSIGRAWWTMEVKHSLSAWDPSRGKDLELSPTRISKLIAEKDAACSLARELHRQITADDKIDAVLLHTVKEAFSILIPYVDGLALCAEVCLRARWQQQAPLQANYAAFRDAVARLEEFGSSLRELTEQAQRPHQVIMLLDFKRVADVVREAQALLSPSRCVEQ